MTSSPQVVLTEEPLMTKYIRIFLVVSLYWFVSISMVFMNKSLLSGSEDLNAPFFITQFQCIVTIMCCYSVYGLSLVFPALINFPRPDISLERCIKVLPLSLVFVGMIAFNNLCLYYVSVSFYFISRSLSTVFNVICTYFIIGQTTSVPALLCCGSIILGFTLGVDQEDGLGTLSIPGVIFGVLASLFVSLNAIYTKKILGLVNDNIWTLQLLNNINATFLFVPLIIVNSETSTIMSSTVVPTVMFWTKMLVAGFFGFSMGYVTGLQIKVTSPLTHNISGTAKAAAQTVIATQVNHEVKSFWWWMSNVVVLGGSAAYARVRSLEMAQK